MTVWKKLAQHWWTYLSSTNSTASRPKLLTYMFD